MTELDKLNRRLGEAIGVNPHNEPLYKWFHTDSWMHHMKKLNGQKPVMTPSGIIVMEPVYVERLMCPELRGHWIIGHWHDAGSQSNWLRENGTSQLWPSRGYYVKTDAVMPRGQFPTDTRNEEIIFQIRKRRTIKAEQAAEIMQAAIDHDERVIQAERRDRINELLPTYGHVPGIRGGHVSYPSVGK